jgi:hypothetical protein
MVGLLPDCGGGRRDLDSLRRLSNPCNGRGCKGHGVHSPWEYIRNVADSFPEEAGDHHAKANVNDGLEEACMFELVRDEVVNPNYAGEATRFVYSFTVNLPDQFLADWVANRVVTDHANELEKNGTELLRLKVWEDKQSGTFSTDFQVEVTAAGYGDADQDVSSKIGVAPAWFIPAIIIAVLAIIGGLVVNMTLNTVQHIIQSPGGATALSILGLAALGLVVIGGIYVLKKRG